MIRLIAFALVWLAAFAAPLAAQAPELAGEPRTMAGIWEFSTADRERSCVITFRTELLRIGRRVEFDPACAGKFPFIREIVGWRLAENDFLRLLDARGNTILEFSEVESGIFEAPRPGVGILFIQSAAALGPAPRKSEQMAGEWLVTRRAGRPICGLALTNDAAGDEFAIRIQGQCDPLVRRFGPATWQMDRGELVLRSAEGQTWRFEEIEGAKWRRIPETSDPVLMVRK
jgi:Protease inhibitor Inh